VFADDAHWPNRLPIGKSGDVPSAGSRLLSALTGLWGPRISWLVVGACGVWSIGDAVDDRSAALRATVTIAAWLLWGAGIVALVVPSTLGLTAMRMVTTLSCGAAAISWIGGAAPAPGGAFLTATLICGVLVGGAGFGQHCVQASAYGDERRFLLRPPAAFLLPVAVAGLLWAAATLTAPLLLATGQWIAGVPAAIVAGLLTWLLLPRFNTLSRRWLVLVPAGVVVHDQVVLAETLMVPRPDVDRVGLALAGTEAADLTGPAAGHAVEVALREMATALLAPTKAAPRGSAIHARSFIIAPTRPGAVLRAAAEVVVRPR
jgi:hypothetical protein